MKNPTKFQVKQAQHNGHSFHSYRHDDDVCWFCGNPRHDVLHATDFLVYGEVLDGIMKYLRNQAEAINQQTMLDRSAYDWKHIVKGEDVHVQPEETDFYRHRNPAGLFLDFAKSGDYQKEGPLTRYEIRLIGDSHVKLSSGKALPQFGLYRGNLLICTYLGTVDLRDAKQTAIKAHHGHFPHIEKIGPHDEDNNE